MARVKGPHPLGPFVVYVFRLLTHGAPATLQGGLSACPLTTFKVVDSPTLFAGLALQYP
jgi:hypothetical protein